MHIERISLRNFRCFGPEGAEIRPVTSLTAFVGINGSGKAIFTQAIQRLFGVTGEQRRLRSRDFHIPSDEKVALTERQLELEAILAFPELDGGIATTAVPECFQHIAADENRHKSGNPEGLATFSSPCPEQNSARCSCSVRRSAARPRWLTSINCWPMLVCTRSPYRRSRRALRTRPRHISARQPSMNQSDLEPRTLATCF